MAYYPGMNKIFIRHFFAWTLLSLGLTACSKNEMKGVMDITFEVTAPGLSESDTIYLTGNIAELGNWNLQDLAMERTGKDTWKLVVQIPYGARLEYKFTLGSWTREALNDDGSSPANFKSTATRSHTLKHTFNVWKKDGIPSEGVTGRVTYHMDVAGAGLLSRHLIVWLPPGYEENTETRYPVLYMHDGQNVFDPATSFLGTDWGVDETITRLMSDDLMKPVIVVGIYNSPDRSDDYGTGEKGIAYQKFVVNVVKPLIDSTYRTKPGREDTAVMGSSMGGLISFLLAWNYPQVFQQAACLSPAFFTNAVEMVRSAPTAPEGMRIYMDNGTVGLEKELQVMCDDMMSALAPKGFVPGSNNFEWFLDQGAEHNERAWSIRVEKPLLFMFGTESP